MTYLKQIDFNTANMSAFGTLETGELTPVLHMDFVYGINSQTGVSTTANSATVDTNASRLRLQSGTNSAGSAIFRSKRVAKYRAGLGCVLRYTPIFTTGLANSTQIMGIGDDANGYFFGYNGTAFGILHRNAGVNTWTAQTSWNGDKVNGGAGTAFTWDPTKGTPTMIKYPFLGYGDIFFYVQNPNDGRWVLVHTIKFANTVATTQWSNPNVGFYAQALNAGNTTNLTMYCGSVGCFISGARSFNGNPRWAMDNSLGGVTTEANLLSLQNAASYNGVVNRSLIRLSSLSIASSAAAGAAAIRLKIGVTLGGTPSYTPINGSTADNGVTITAGNSMTSYDIAGTTITGGMYILGVTVDNPNSQMLNLEPYDLYLAPGEFLTISGSSTVSSTLAIGVNWSEDI